MLLVVLIHCVALTRMVVRGLCSILGLAQGLNLKSSCHSYEWMLESTWVRIRYLGNRRTSREKITLSEENVYSTYLKLCRTRATQSRGMLIWMKSFHKVGYLISSKSLGEFGEFVFRRMSSSYLRREHKSMGYVTKHIRATVEVVWYGNFCCTSSIYMGNKQPEKRTRYRKVSFITLWFPILDISDFTF